MADRRSPSPSPPTILLLLKGTKRKNEIKATDKGAAAARTAPQSVVRHGHFGCRTVGRGWRISARFARQLRLRQGLPSFRRSIRLFGFIDCPPLASMIRALQCFAGLVGFLTSIGENCLKSERD